MDLSTSLAVLNHVTQDLKQENDRKSVVTLIQDLAFVVEQLHGHAIHYQNCACNRPEHFEGCDCGLERLEGQIEDVLLRAQEARR